MFSNIKAKFKANPKWYYAMSIVASWAGVGSLMNFRTLALQNGVAPAVVWAVFNSLACILFGVLAEYLPYMRGIMQTRVMSWFIGLLTIFQTWTQMSGITEIFADTALGATYGMVLAYIVAIVFVVVPIVARSDFTIIDGFHRWTVAGREPLKTRLGGKVPVVIVDHHGDGSADVYGTITHNRARGQHLLEPMKAIVKKLMDEGKSVKEIGKQLGMKPEEVFSLSGFTREEFLELMTKGHDTYSRAVVYTHI